MTTSQPPQPNPHQQQLQLQQKHQPQQQQHMQQRRLSNRVFLNSRDCLLWGVGCREQHNLWSVDCVVTYYPLQFDPVVVCWDYGRILKSSKKRVQSWLWIITVFWTGLFPEVGFFFVGGDKDQVQGVGGVSYHMIVVGEILVLCPLQKNILVILCL